MWYIIVIAVFILVSFYLQYLLTSRSRKWTSISLMVFIFIPSIVFLIMNYMDAFEDVEGFGGFLLNYGTDGLIALILKTGLILFPTFIHIFIYLLIKYQNRMKEKQLDKMIVSDM